MYRINIDRDKCIACLTCVTACIVANNSCDARDRITLDSDTKPSQIFCRHCDAPECVFTCMTGAMRKNNQNGFVEYNKNQCASCYMCIMACPYGVLKADRVTRKEILKCNMCVHRTEDGSPKPACVEKCPMNAIILSEVN